MNNISPRSAIILLVVIVIIQAIYYYAKLPDTVASHFSLLGEPDAWTSKQTLIGFNCTLALVTGSFFIIFSRLPHRLASQWLQIPNRDYWLSPDKLAQTHDKLSGMILWIGAATLAFFVLLFYQVYAFNAGSNPALGLGTPLALLGIAIIAVVVPHYRFFRRTRD